MLEADDTTLARAALAAMYGPGAEFRAGQLEAIEAVMRPASKVLVIQGTGWGKTAVYLVAARLLRRRGEGPTVVVSPLLSLMRNQVASAEAAGIAAAAITSENRSEWDTIRRELVRGRLDLVLVSPERLAYGGFRRGVLQQLPKGIGLLAIDEAHCVSDWGHDFRPDYRRAVQRVRDLQSHVRVLATTGTADARVVADMEEQLGEGLTVLRGPLARPSLRLQTIRLARPAARLAWLSAHLPQIEGPGIVYCLTRRDTETVSSWLGRSGVEAPAYHAGLSSEERQSREGALLRNECKALCATVALGMGFDKPDLAFVVHYGRPRSLIDYYQQVGRAGRAIPEAYCVLLCGAGDSRLEGHLAGASFPAAEEQSMVLAALEASSGLTQWQVAARVDLPMDRIEQCLKLLRAEGVASCRQGRWFRRPGTWSPDYERWARIGAQRLAELEGMGALARTTGCLMEFMTEALGDPLSAPCGQCAHCAGPVFSARVSWWAARDAARHVASLRAAIEPRRLWPADGESAEPEPIAPPLQLRRGMALCTGGDPAWGRLVAGGEHARGRLSWRLVRASARLIREWGPHPTPTWVTSVPSRGRPRLVEGFARRLAAALGLQYRPALTKCADAPRQRSLNNSPHLCANARGSFRADRSLVLRGSPVLLVDDVVDSRWTLTVCGALLREAGAGPVFPFALAATTAMGRP